MSWPFFILSNIIAQKSSKQQSDAILSAIHGVQSSSTENRLPELLNDAKVLLTDAFIADILSDTFEVVYNLNRIFINMSAEKYKKFKLILYMGTGLLQKFKLWNQKFWSLALKDLLEKYWSIN